MLPVGCVLLVGPALVVEVVPQLHQSLWVRVLARALCHGTPCALDGVHVPAESLGLGVLVDEDQRSVASPGGEVERHAGQSPSKLLARLAVSGTRSAGSPSRTISNAYCPAPGSGTSKTSTAPASTSVTPAGGSPNWTVPS